MPTFVQTIVAMVPQNPIAAAAQGDLLAVIFTVIVFGAAATTMSEERRRPLVALGQAVNDVSLIVIQFLMRLAPVAVGILIAGTVLRSGIDLLWSLAGFVTVVIAGLALHVALVLLPILQLGVRIGVVAFLQAVGHVILLAFSTASSSVTLPVSMAAARERLGVSAGRLQLRAADRHDAEQERRRGLQGGDRRVPRAPLRRAPGRRPNWPRLC